jgi:hypothetical protein
VYKTQYLFFFLFQKDQTERIYSEPAIFECFRSISPAIQARGHGLVIF